MNVGEMRAMHVRASNFFGGPEKQILGHAVHAMRTPGSGIRVTVLSFGEKGRETELVTRARAAGLEARSIPCFTAYDPRQVGRLREAVSEAAPDVVCTHDYRSSVLCLLALGGSKVPQVVFWRGVTRENLKVRLFHRIERRVLAGVSHVVVVAQEQRTFLTGRGFPPGKVTLVPNAVDVPHAAGERDGGARWSETSGPREAGTSGENATSGGTRRPRRERLESVVGALEARTVLAAASRLSPEKGVNQLLDAMPAILKKNRNVTLLIFGDGPLMVRLRSQAARLGCAEHVRFAGLVPDFASYVGEVDVFVLPSLSEGLPNALLEAMAASRPVVATSVGGVKDLLRDGENGLVVRPADSEALAAAVLRLASDPELASRLGRSARAAVAGSHSFARQFELLRNVYRGVTGRA